MKNVLVIYYFPAELGVSMEEIKNGVLGKDFLNYLFKVRKYVNEANALMAYAETSCTWSTLLDDSANVAAFIEEAWQHILDDDYNWLEHNFV